MNIFTDDTTFIKKYIETSNHWDSITNSIQTPHLMQIHKNIFSAGSDSQLNSVQDSFWNYGWFVKHSVQSQFEVLTRLSGIGVSLPDRLICVAGSGDHFKGYRNRTWETAPGNLHLTIHFAPNQEIEHFFSGFLMLAAVSVVQTVNSFPGLNGKLGIKWVNDILIDRAKVAGVLTHTSSKGEMVTSALLGIGINVLTIPEVEADVFVPQVTALHKHLNEQTSLKLVLQRLLDAIQKNYKLLLSGDHQQLLSIYRHYSTVLGQNVQIYSDPISGNPQFVTSGIVQEITQDLELRLIGHVTPVRSGRIVM